jgi:hypothetical protein
MRGRPHSPTGLPWFLYKVSRKIRYLKHHETLFRKSPRKEKHPEEKERHTYRKLRYLTKNGRLFQTSFGVTGKFLNQNLLFMGRAKYLTILVNSTAIFLLANLFVFVIREFSTGIAASSFNIRTILLYYDVDFLIRSRDWAKDAVQVVFSTGPFIGFILALVSLVIFSSFIEEIWIGRLFLLWIFCHAFTQFLGEIIFGAIFNQGFGWVLAYLYFNETEKMLLVVILLIGIFVCGLFLPRYFLVTGNIYFNDLDKGNRMHLIISQVLLPFLIGTGVIFLLKQPGITNLEMVVDSSMAFLLLPVILRARVANDLFFDEEPRKIRLHWKWILATILALVIFRILFWKGIRL